MDQFRNISLANPFDQENEIWAICYLGKDGDEKNVLKLDTKELVIIKNGKKRQFEISEISGIYKSHRRLLLPFILGGILTPLSIIAIYENTFHPILLLIVFFSGIFLLYMGWAGSDTLIISMLKNKDEDFYIRIIPKQVKKFIAFLNSFIAAKKENTESPIFYYSYNSPSELYNFSKTGDSEYILMTVEEFEQFSKSGGYQSRVIKIDPRKLTVPIRLHEFPDGSSYFTVESINSESILKVN